MFGLKQTEHHSPAAFLASQIACKELCSKLDKEYRWDPNNIESYTNKALVDCNARVGSDDQINLNENQKHRQQHLSQAIDKKLLNNIKSLNQDNIHFQAHLNHTTNSGAGSWLHYVPSQALRTNVDPLLYRTMIMRWLRVPIHEVEFHCSFCDEIVDKYADHCLICAMGGDRTKRHNLLRNEIFYF